MRVGITGHRWTKLRPEAEDEVAAALRGVFATLGPHATLVSGMAEGADLIAARTRPVGWALEAALLLPQAAWRRHMSTSATLQPGDVPTFDQQIAAATLMVAPVSDMAPDYEWLAAHLAATCDCLVAVWNGTAGGPGGTSDAVLRAQRAGVPVHVLWDTTWARPTR